MPDSRLPILSSHVRLGASSISRTRSSKYVGWLVGSSIGPLSLYYRAVSQHVPSPGVSVPAHPVAKLVLHEKLQRARLEQLLGLSGRGRRAGVALVDDPAQDVLELVVGAQLLLGPLGEDVAVDAALRGGQPGCMGTGAGRGVPLLTATWLLMWTERCAGWHR